MDKGQATKHPMGENDVIVRATMQAHARYGQEQFTFVEGDQLHQTGESADRSEVIFKRITGGTEYRIRKEVFDRRTISRLSKAAGTTGQHAPLPQDDL